MGWFKRLYFIKAGNKNIDCIDKERDAKCNSPLYPSTSSKNIFVVTAIIKQTNEPKNNIINCTGHCYTTCQTTRYAATLTKFVDHIYQHCGLMLIIKGTMLVILIVVDLEQ